MLSVIALAGIVNLIGATFMGVEQRKKELGILIAVGLSRKNVGKLLVIESRWVSLLCTAMSAVLGLGLGLGLYALVVRAGADYMRFVFPLWPLIAVCAVMWLVPYAVTLTAAHSLKRSTIVDLLGRLT
jgi:putative ABC transport system permease protein